MVTSKKAPHELMSPEDLVLQGIVTLRTEKSKGIHAVRSGFNQAFRDYFGNEADPIETTTQMRKDGKIAVILVKGGAMLYLRDDLQPSTLARHDADWEKREREGTRTKAASKVATESNVLTKILKG